MASWHQICVHRDHPSHSWPMLGGMWGARFDSLKKKSNKDEENREEEDGKVNQEATKEEKVGESHGASGEARSLLSGLVSDMLHSPISWASVYLADQASISPFLLKNHFFKNLTTRCNFNGCSGRQFRALLW